MESRVGELCSKLRGLGYDCFFVHKRAGTEEVDFRVTQHIVNAKGVPGFVLVLNEFALSAPKWIESMSCKVKLDVPLFAGFYRTRAGEHFAAMLDLGGEG